MRQRVREGLPWWKWTAVHAYRLFLLIAVLATMAVCATLEASEDRSGISGGDSSENSEYRLAPGDHLSVVVFDQDQLSGDFIVNSAGQLQLPLAGAIAVGGLTLAEAQKLVQERFADGILVQPMVSLRITEYRPIVVFGNVKTPGSYPFQFGQSVRAVIARAGGEGRVNEHPSAMSDFIMADERVRLLETRRLGLLVRKARLVAQRDELPDFNIPQLIAFETDNAKVDLFYTAEHDLFFRLMDGYRDQLNLLQQQRPRIEEEIIAVTAQFTNERRRLAIIKSRVAELDDYKARGLVRTHLLNDQQREEARAAAEVARLEAELARLKRQMGDVDIRIQEVESRYRQQVTTELHETLQNLHEIEVTLQTSRELRDYRGEDAGIAEGADSTDTIRISRIGQKGSVVTFRATYDTLIEPGDIIEVKRKAFGPLRPALGVSAAAAINHEVVPNRGTE